MARRHKMQEGKAFEERYIAYPDARRKHDLFEWFEHAIRAEAEGGIVND